MKGKEMIELIKKHNLEDFNLEFVFTEINELGIHVRTFNIDGLCDIGYSSDEVSFDGDEK